MRRVLSTLPTLAVLVAVLAYGMSEKVHARLLSFAEANWPGYHRLRIEPRPPDCAVAPADNDHDALDDLLDDEPSPANGKNGIHHPKQDSLLDDLVEDDNAEKPNDRALMAAQRQCDAAKRAYTQIKAQVTPAVRWFRFVETGLARWAEFAVRHLSHALIVLLLVAATTATWTSGHIALRSPLTRTESRVSSAAELVAASLLWLSSIAAWRTQAASGTAAEAPELYALWIVGFCAVTTAAVIRLIQPNPELPFGGTIKRGLLTVPLYAIMTMISGTYFILAEGHASGLAIYLDKLSEHALLYTHIGLYVWVGMLLKQTRISTLVLNMAKPWRMSPELFAIVIVVAAALPTAYSGASGIFVIAAGSLIYDKLRATGCRRGLALATTAMSGSMGVVLSPCLLVVIVASLNKQVTTEELYGWGRWVFALTTALFAIVLWVTRQAPLTIASPSHAVPRSLSEAKPLLPYIGLFVLMAGVAAFGLDARLDEHSAPVLLPFIMLVLLAYDRSSRRSARGSPTPSTEPLDGTGTFGAITEATEETSSHIGALLLLMGLSVCIGGVIERSEMMSMVPQDFGSAGIAMAYLVVVLVLIGMVMDPYGAVILVSATLAPIAANNGVHPVHFWMVVLVAFELGYLTPPVALNHLLTRQVVGVQQAAVGANDTTGSLWARYERLLLPMVVMGAALFLVAFGPFAVSGMADYPAFRILGGLFDASR